MVYLFLQIQKWYQGLAMCLESGKNFANLFTLPYTELILTSKFGTSFYAQLYDLNWMANQIDYL